MSGRYRTVALQAIGVAVLAAVVFIAFLRPSEPGDLSGIDAPGGDDGPPVVVNPPNDDKKKGGKEKKGAKKGDRQNRGSGRPNGPGGNDSGRRGPGGPNGGANGGITGGGQDASPDGVGSPPDDQYADLVTLLMKQVGEPTLWREINDR